MTSGKLYVAGQSDKSKTINVYDGSVENLVYSYKSVDTDEAAKEAFTRVRNYIAIPDPSILKANKPETKSHDTASTTQQEHTLVATNEKLMKMAAMLSALLGEDESEESKKPTASHSVREKPSASFDVLKIPGLEQEPARPQFTVVFDLGDAGKFTTAYHWVNLHDGKLHLIYDTRFQYGTLYVPPSNGKQMVVTLSDHNKSYVVRSPDNILPFGVFHIISMPILPDTQSNKHLYTDIAESYVDPSSILARSAEDRLVEEGSFESALGDEIDMLRQSVLRYDR